MASAETAENPARSAGGIDSQWNFSRSSAWGTRPSAERSSVNSSPRASRIARVHDPWRPMLTSLRR